VTLAPATGFGLARIILDGKVDPELEPFRVGRPAAPSVLARLRRNGSA
jgi:hypothetical protein